jgi:hypothetical protein
MAANDGENPVTSNFGVPLPAGTGAPGSASAGVSDPLAAGAVTVAVTRPGGGFYDQVQVGVDADDVLVPAQAAGYAREPVSGVTGIDSTGAGTGSAHPINPNAVDVPPMGAQLRAARRSS